MGRSATACSAFRRCFCERSAGAAASSGADDFDRLWQIVNENNRDCYEAYQRKTTRPIPILAVTPE